MTMPAATLILHGIAHDSRLAGGHAERVWRRLGALLALVGGAAVGAWVSARSLPAGLACVSVVIALAAAMLRLGRDEPAPL